jgi:hypothetical protein
MKTFKLLIIAVLLMAAQQGYAQDCPDEVSTDPRNPINFDRPALENTFFWFPHNGNDYNSFEILTSGGTYPSINNPFWNPTSLMVGQLVNLQNSDFYPEDGWELLKVNFGRLNDGTERAIKPSMPYMILYNRYSGTMRFLGMWPNASNSWQIIRFKIGIPENKWTSQPNTTGDPLQATNLLSIQGDAIQPLDQETTETVYEVITEYPGISNASFFFWFDLPVAYDPCICNNDVALTLEATVENQWDVTIKGILDAQIIQQGVPQNGNSNLVTERIIGAAGATATAIATNGTVINTGAFVGLLDIFTQRPGVSEYTESNLEFLQDILNAAAEVTYDSGSLEWRNTVTGDTLTKKDWQKLFSGIGSYLNAGVDFANPGSQTGKPKTSVVGSITATGTATLSQNPGDLVYLGVPGSNWTNSLDEVIESTANGINPEYPIYNNPLGTIALLQTPKIYVTNSGINYCDEYVDDGGPNEEPFWQTLTKTRVRAWLKDDLKYYLNPVLNIDAEKTEILGSIVVEQTNFTKFEFGLSCPDEGDSEYLTLSEQIELSKKINLIETVEKNKMMTPPVPIDYLKEVVTEFLVGSPPYTFSANGEFMNYFIRLTINMVSNDIGKDGEQVTNTQIVTFPLEAITASGTSSPELIDIVDDLGITTFDSEMTDLTNDNYSYHPDYICITSPLASASSGPSHFSILSESVIHLKPGAQLNPSLRLAIDLPFEGLYPQEPVSANYVSDFCQNNITENQYQANQFSALAPQLPPPSAEFLEQYYQPEKILNKIILSPNPARDLLTLRSSHLDMTSITIHDLSGRPIKQKTLQAHSRETQINLSGIAPGTYIVRVDCGDDVFSEKLLVAK